MKWAIYAALLLVLACKPLHRSGDGQDSELQSITDGRMTLGVVPVTGDVMDGYALLLCKNEHSYSAAKFTDDRYCRPALLTASGQQAVFIPDQMKGHDGSINYRSMVTKSAIFLGVAGLATIGGSYIIKKLGQNSDQPLKLTMPKFTRKISSLAKRSGIDKEVLDYNRAVRNLRKAEDKLKAPEILQKHTDAVAEKKAILASATGVETGLVAQRMLDSFAVKLQRFTDKSKPKAIKDAWQNTLEAEKAKIIAKQGKFEKVSEPRAAAVITENYQRYLKVFDNIDGDAMKGLSDSDLDLAKAKQLIADTRERLNKEITKKLNDHATLLDKRKFNAASLTVESNKIIDTAAYAATTAGAALLLTSTLAPNLFVKHPHGAGADGTLRAHWQKVFIFQDYGFGQAHEVKSIHTILRKIADELNLQVNPRISSW
ncbi:MAG: hypothetical protein OYH77_06015 [Pseudomonadota bacterium]|nr:hypothetical protein [Pseudomonadota bacterium]